MTQQLLPALSDEAYGTLVLAVVERSLKLRVREVGRGVFYVDGGREPHWVNLYDHDVPRCDCVDHEVRNRLCKHIVAALIYIADYRLYRRLVELVEL